MRVNRSLIIGASVLTLGACGDSSGPKMVPSSVEIVSAAPATPAAGVLLPTSPAFIVKDQNGNPMGGVPVTVVVSTGGGTLTAAPALSAKGPTPIGQWVLGRAAGANSLTIAVEGLAPVTLTVTSVAGAAAKFVPQSPTELSGTVGQGASPLPAVRVTDAFDNPVPMTVITLTWSGGGSISTPTVISDATGNATIPDWTLGTVKGPNTLTMTAGAASIVFTTDAVPGPLQTIAIVSGDGQSALAGTRPSVPIRLSPQDQYGNTIANQAASFSIGAGGGFLAAAAAQAGPDGFITAPAWTLGRSAVPQQLLATIGGSTVTVNATIQTSYAIEIRFWGAPMTSEQRALFTAAAARIRGFVVGALPIDDATGADPAACGVNGVPVLNETVPGVLIYASIQDIDGKGGTLARAGPCYFRSSTDLRTVIGVMEFDAADIGSLEARGSLREVITHEMLHVVGVGSVWNQKGLLQNYNTSTVGYTGVGGVRGCGETGGTTTCASTVPVENTGGSGTANSHWRESVFANELMTGYINDGSLPLSVMTVRSIEDLGYTANPFGADPYVIAIGSLRDGALPSLISPPGVAWERGLPAGPFILPRRSSSGTVPKLR